ncbi:hypothetical protein D3C81_1908700 [compost metagenome]
MDLSKILGIPASYEWKADDIRPNGSRRRENYISCKYQINDREFSALLRNIVKSLYMSKSALQEFIASGGRVEIYLQLNGTVNVGDELEPDLLTSIGEAQINLQIEVFPNYGIKRE